MAARLITQEEVANVCNELIAASEQPKTLNVHKMLGRGSYSTIQKYIHLWRDSDSAKSAQAEMLPAVVELPKEFQEAGKLLLKKIFNLAAQEQSIKIEEIRSECDLRTKEAKEIEQESIDYADTLSNEMEELKEQLVEATDKVKLLDKDKSILENKLIENQRNMRTLDENLNKADRDIKTLTGSLAESQTNAALLNQEKEQLKKVLIKSDSDYSELKIDLNAEIKTLKEDYITAIKDLKNDHLSAIKTLTTATDKTIKLAENAASEAKKERDEAKKERDEAKKERDEADKRIVELEQLIANKQKTSQQQD